MDWELDLSGGGTEDVVDVEAGLQGGLLIDLAAHDCVQGLVFASAQVGFDDACLGPQVEEADMVMEWIEAEIVKNGYIAAARLAADPFEQRLGFIEIVVDTVCVAGMKGGVTKEHLAETLLDCHGVLIIEPGVHA